MNRVLIVSRFIVHFKIIFNTILIDSLIDWLKFYKKTKTWILASLNVNYSLVPEEIWNSTPFDANYAESAHANVNQTGKNLKLKSAILK